MATTNNIGLYCFDTGNEDAKTSLEALFGAGNSNMKKIDDAIGELRKKSFIVNTEEELNALLTEENLGKTVSYNGALYVIAEGGGTENPTAVGDNVTEVYFDATKSNEEILQAIQSLDWDNPDYNGDGKAINLFVEAQGGTKGMNIQTLEGDLFEDGGHHVIYMIGQSGDYVWMYSSTVPADAMGVESWGWVKTSPCTLQTPFTINHIGHKDIWGSWLSATNEFAGGGGIIAKPVGAEGGGGLPSFAPEDAGKFLRVDSNGNIVAEAIAYAEGESF